MSLPLSDFVSVWAFLAVNILSPGPNVLNTIATAMGGGRRAGLAAALGVGTGVGVWCLGMAFGVAALLAAWPPGRGLLTGVAVVLLAVYAMRYLRTARRLWQDRGAAVAPLPRHETAGAAYRRSLAVIALNPKALTSWLAVLSVFPVARAGAGDIAILGAGTCLLSAVIHASYALAFSTPAAARLYLRAGWAVSGGAGLFFACVAVTLAGSLLPGGR